MSRRRTQERQDAAAAKIFEDVVYNGVRVVCYQRKKKPAQPNRKGGATPSDEEADEMTGNFARLLGILLPGILVKLSQIDDPRDQSKVKYSIPMLMLFGIIMFLCHSTSRRDANRVVADNNLLTMVEEFVPGVSELPHADTLARLLCKIDVEEIDRYYEEILAGFIGSKQFREINPGRLIIAEDGTQKFSRKYLWDDRALSRNAGDEKKQRFYVYALESVLILENGMVLPLLTEILENHTNDTDKPGVDQTGAGKIGTSELTIKQDCETKAFRRLSERLVKLVGMGCVTVLLDGIYASGPIVSICEKYGWDYMITLKRDCLTTVWEDFLGLQQIETDNSLLVQWGDRQQEYRWSNDLEYTYGKNHKKLKLNVVTCTETWTEEHPRSGGKPEEKKTEYAWLSSQRVTSENVFHLCTDLARSRWRIENNFLLVKHHGYNYSHCYSYNWNAMKGFHYLMKFGIFINVFIMFSVDVVEYVRIEGFRGFVKKIWGFLRNGKWTITERSDKEAKKPRTRMRFTTLIKAA